MSRSPASFIGGLCLFLALGGRLSAVDDTGDAAGKFQVDREWKIEGTPLDLLEPSRGLALTSDAEGHIVTTDATLFWRGIFGVEFVFPSRDVRDLTAGPDGRLYFFCGEGGLAIHRKDGGTLQVPPEGAIFRSEPDGGYPEIFCRGLRAPAALAFDHAGNLFAVDGGEKEQRWLALVERGDYGWRNGGERSASRDGNRSGKIGVPDAATQPAWCLPAVGGIPGTAEGLAYYPGTGLSPRFVDHFFAADSLRNGIFAWASKPNGGSFLMIDAQELVTGAKARAVAFGPDNKLYFAVAGDSAPHGKANPLFCLSPASGSPDPQADEVRGLLDGGLKQKPSIELRGLLKHPDQRVRLAAEWALAASPDGEFLLREVALSPNGGQEPSIARVHGVWGLESVARHAEQKTPGAGGKMVEPLIPLLEDDDTEVKAQVAGLMGEFRVDAAFDGLIKALRNPDEKVSRFAAEALGKLARAEAMPQVLLMAREAGDHDPYLRHAYVDALLGFDDFPALEKAAGDESASVRMIVLLAMRQLRRPEIARFLHDEDASLVREAAMAINDEAIAEAAK